MNLRQEIEEIRLQYLSKQITYDEAKKKLIPIVNEFNTKGMEIAKKYGRRFKKIGIVGLLR